MKARAVIGCFLIWLGAVAAAPGAPDRSLAANVVGERFRDCADCPEMIVLPAGTVRLGSPEDEPGRRPDEGPQQVVRIDRPFAVGRYEVTRAQYEVFLRRSKRKVSGQCITDRRNPGTWAPDARTNVRDPGFAQGANHPGACVSWNDAIAYVDWLNAKTGAAAGYRLLTEAEWEYVARAGSTTAYPWGQNIADGCPHMNGYDRVILAKKGDLYKGEDVPFAACSDGYLYTAPVGSFTPNAFGVYDMIGNVSEWVQDCATDSYAGSGSADCTKRMVRGGSWGTQPRQLRSAERMRYSPTDVDDSIGIRVARSVGRAT